jgi:hypothetical protein
LATRTATTPCDATPGLGVANRRRAPTFQLSFVPGEAYQFDWSHEIVVMDGATTTLKVAHVRLCHSRMMFVRAYPRETQEIALECCPCDDSDGLVDAASSRRG